MCLFDVFSIAFGGAGLLFLFAGYENGISLVAGIIFLVAGMRFLLFSITMRRQARLKRDGICYPVTVISVLRQRLLSNGVTQVKLLCQYTDDTGETHELKSKMIGIDRKSVNVNALNFTVWVNRFHSRRYLIDEKEGKVALDPLDIPPPDDNGWGEAE